MVVTPFQEEIIAGYESDPWFTEEANTKSLSKIDNIWIPEHLSLRHKIMYEMHNPLTVDIWGLATLSAIQPNIIGGRISKEMLSTM